MQISFTSLMRQLVQQLKSFRPLAAAREIWFLFRDTIQAWNRDKANRMSAGLAYYTIFSMAPFLLIAIFIAGLVFGPAAAQGRVLTEISSIVGRDTAGAIQQILLNANRPFTGALATIIGTLTMLYGASGMFLQIQDSLDIIWKVPPKENPHPFDFLKTRFMSFLMVLAAGVLLLLLLTSSTLQSTINTYFSQYFSPDEDFWRFNNFLTTFLMITAIFAMVFKIIPRVPIRWRDVWLGAMLTALLFNLAKTFLAMYLGSSSISTTYGAASSLMILMIWVYYSAQVFLFGAEFTRVYTQRFGSMRPQPPAEQPEAVSPPEQRIPEEPLPLLANSQTGTDTAAKPAKASTTVKVIAAAVPILAGVTFAAWKLFFNPRKKSK